MRFKPLTDIWNRRLAFCLHQAFFPNAIDRQTIHTINIDRILLGIDCVLSFHPTTAKSRGLAGCHFAVARSSLRAPFFLTPKAERPLSLDPKP